MFCYSPLRNGEAFCCQEVELNGGTGGTQHPLKYNPDDAKRLMEELKIQAELEKASVTKAEDDSDVGMPSALPPAPEDKPTTAQPLIPKGRLRYADNEDNEDKPAPPASDDDSENREA